MDPGESDRQKGPMRYLQPPRAKIHHPHPFQRPQEHCPPLSANTERAGQRRRRGRYVPKAQHGSVTRLSMVEFPENPEVHPMPRVWARSLAVGSAHSHASPQVPPCPRARNAPATKATPDIPPPRATIPGEGQGGAKRRGPDVLKVKRMGVPENAAEIGRKPRRKAPEGAA